MSLSGAISAAVTALSAQSAALSLISNNLANSSTTAYKTTTASFASLLAGGGATSGVASGGVSLSGISNISEQGLLTSTSVSTNIAIDGSGFFVASGRRRGGGVYYTRNGEFEVNENGYLVNNGYYLQGWETDSDGNVIGGTTASNLESIDVDSISTMVSETTEMSFSRQPAGRRGRHRHLHQLARTLRFARHGCKRDGDLDQGRRQPVDRSASAIRSATACRSAP